MIVRVEQCGGFKDVKVLESEEYSINSCGELQSTKKISDFIITPNIKNTMCGIISCIKNMIKGI